MDVLGMTKSFLWKGRRRVLEKERGRPMSLCGRARLVRGKGRNGLLDLMRNMAGSCCFLSGNWEVEELKCAQFESLPIQGPY